MRGGGKSSTMFVERTAKERLSYSTNVLTVFVPKIIHYYTIY